MEKEKKSKTDGSRYFDELLMRIRDIRVGERSAIKKISDVIASTADYDGGSSIRRFIGYAKQLGDLGATERFANRLLLYAETSAKMHQALYGKDIEVLAHGFINDNSFKQDIYDYPSYQGIYEENDEGGQVRLPEELQNFQGGSMVLKIEDMDRLVDTFCSRNTYYRRAYAILADLDKEVLDCVETGVFPQWMTIPYKEYGDAMFEFSHFECDLREPDEKYRTLYVVYRYDATVS
ncbi:MAG: virulence RhuM family protein [Bacteroidaceae bacterium]|nr:virulence RhuM family protein [Bacteroidaceae bacterium]